MVAGARGRARGVGVTGPVDGVVVGSFLMCIVAGVFPWVNGEIVVTGAALLVAPPKMAALVAAAATGQMLAKTAIYGVARWAPERLPRKARRALSRSEVLGRSRVATGLALLVSSSIGFPPFYLTTLAAGVLRVPLGVFAAVGLAGTLLRYTAVVVAATLVASGAGAPAP